jgi:hypothetical protein
MRLGYASNMWLTAPTSGRFPPVTGQWLSYLVLNPAPHLKRRKKKIPREWDFLYAWFRISMCASSEIQTQSTVRWQIQGSGQKIPNCPLVEHAVHRSSCEPEPAVTEGEVLDWQEVLRAQSESSLPQFTQVSWHSEKPQFLDCLPQQLRWWW